MLWNVNNLFVWTNQNRKATLFNRINQRGFQVFRGELPILYKKINEQTIFQLSFLNFCILFIFPFRNNLSLTQNSPFQSDGTFCWHLAAVSNLKGSMIAAKILRVHNATKIEIVHDERLDSSNLKLTIIRLDSPNKLTFYCKFLVYMIHFLILWFVLKLPIIGHLHPTSVNACHIPCVQKNPGNVLHNLGICEYPPPPFSHKCR